MLYPLKGDAFNPQTKDSGRGLSFDCFADLPAHQGRADRRLKRDLAGLKVHLVGADNFEFHPGVCREIREFHRAQQTDSVLWEGGCINHAGILQDLLQETDAADGLGLPAPCFTVSGILTPVSLRTGLGHHFAYLRVDHADKVIQLGRNLVVSFF